MRWPARSSTRGDRRLTLNRRDALRSLFALPLLAVGGEARGGTPIPDGADVVASIEAGEVMVIEFRGDGTYTVTSDDG